MASLDGLSPQALAAWEALNSTWGQPLTINSAYRDPGHNAKVGGAKRSQHMHGNAFDVDVSGLSTEDRLKLMEAAAAAGFKGFGVYNNALHFDVGAPRFWGPSYKRDSTPAWALDTVSRLTGSMPQPAPTGQKPTGNGILAASAGQTTMRGGGGMDTMQKQREHLLFPNMDPDRRDRIIMSLQGMSMRPNQATIDAAQARIGDRRDQAKLNQTVEWLRANGSVDYADALATGAIDPGAAVQAHMQRQEQAQAAAGEAQRREQAAAMLAPNRPDLAQAVMAGIIDPATAFELSQKGEDLPESVKVLQWKAREAGLQPGTPEYQQFIASGGSAGGGNLSLTPLYGRDADGNIVTMQLSPDGTAVRTQLPEGVAGVDLAASAAARAEGGVVGKASGEAKLNYSGAMAKADQALDLIGQIKDDPALPSILGTFQGRLPAGLPGLTGGQAGADLNAKIMQLQGKVFLEAYESLRGAAAITELEGMKAERAIARLETTQSPEAFRAALAELEEVVRVGRERAAAEAGRAPGNAATPNDDDLFQKYGVSR